MTTKQYLYLIFIILIASIIGAKFFIPTYTKTDPIERFFTINPETKEKINDIYINQESPDKTKTLILTNGLDGNFLGEMRLFIIYQDEKYKIYNFGKVRLGAEEKIPTINWSKNSRFIYTSYGELFDTETKEKIIDATKNKDEFKHIVMSENEDSLISIIYTPIGDTGIQASLEIFFLNSKIVTNKKLWSEQVSPPRQINLNPRFISDNSIMFEWQGKKVTLEF